MTESPAPTANRRWVLASRPSGAATLADFRWEEGPVPEPGAGQMLLRTLELSLDPYMRGRMNDGPSYAAPAPLDAVMLGGTVARVVRSNLAGFAVGDLVSSFNGWQDYALSDGAGVTIIDPALGRRSWALGVLGMPGFAGWHGLTRIARPKSGETVAVSAATGAVGAVVGQLAKLAGCRVVGVAGGPEKCAYAVQTLGYDACVDHTADDFSEQLKAACPDGVDVYFENVGGKVLFSMLSVLNTHARIPICGVIGQYNSLGASGPDQSPRLLGAILVKRLQVQGFIVGDHADEIPQFMGEVGPLVTQGKLVALEDIIDGLPGAPAAFLRLLQGKNFGKLIVHVAE